MLSSRRLTAGVALDAKPDAASVEDIEPSPDAGVQATRHRAPAPAQRPDRPGWHDAVDNRRSCAHDKNADQIGGRDVVVDHGVSAGRPSSGRATRAWSRTSLMTVDCSRPIRPRLTWSLANWRIA